MHRHLRILSLQLFMVLALGCAKLDLNEKLPWAQTKQPQLPEKVLPMWTDTVLYQPGQPGVRGFGGRLFFYGEGDRDPVKVDGSLIVYAFDAEENDPDDPTPKKQYVFTADQLAKHYSKCKLGHSYSVWLPWDEVGGQTNQISLVARFEGRAGGVVFSDPATKMLPGLTANSEKPTQLGHGRQAAGTAETTAVRPATYQAPVTGDEPHRRTRIQVQSSTINLPPSFARHLQGQITPTDVTTPQNSPAADTKPLETPRAKTYGRAGCRSGAGGSSVGGGA